MNARPDPDFKYFSNSKALYLSFTAKYISNLTGKLFFVVCTCPD
jgi:hypothetical protein